MLSGVYLHETLGMPHAMSAFRFADLPIHRGPWVVVAIENETWQAMICVALELGGFRPIAVADPQEAAALTDALSTPPLAYVVTVDEHEAGTADLLRRGRGRYPPTLSLAHPTRSPGEPADLLAVPDLAGMFRVLASLTVA